MSHTHTSLCRSISQIVLVFFCLSLFHPASLRVPWSLSFTLAVSEPGSLSISSALFSIEFGPTSAYASLDPTPGVDPSDPHIADKAAELGMDPAAIFAFVRDGIRNEVYAGALRGARGTLWSSGGNALDKASLLIALLRASNVSAHYVQGTLSDGHAEDVILSMFPPVSSIVGCPAPGDPVADPANDPELLTAVRQHFWVQFNDGGTFQDMDPTFPGAQIGDTFAAQVASFDAVPETLSHTVRFRIKVETSTAFSGSAPVIETVVNETLLTAELAGRPVTLGHFVDSTNEFGAIAGNFRHTYAPYLRIGGSVDPQHDEILRGTDYQEFFSSFVSLSNQLVTGVFLEIDVVSPDGTTETHARTIRDRIGVDMRANGGAVDLAGQSAEESLFLDTDLVTVYALAGLQSPEAVARQKERVEPIHTELQALFPLVEAFRDTGPQTPEEEDLLARALVLARDVMTLGAEVIVQSFAAASDTLLEQVERGYMTRGYYTTPRLLIVSSRGEGGDVSFQLDLRKDDINSVPRPGQTRNAPFYFHITRGLLESALEDELLTQMSGQVVISALDVFAHLSDEEVIVLFQDNVNTISRLAISTEAQTRIRQAVLAGHIVFVPDQMVMVNGQSTIGWLQIDPASGHLIGVTEDGGHGAALQYALISTENPTLPLSALFIGFAQGPSATLFTFLGELFNQFLTEGVSFEAAARAAKQKVSDTIATMALHFSVSLGGSAVGASGLLGQALGFANCAGAIQNGALSIAQPEAVATCLANIPLSKLMAAGAGIAPYAMGLGTIGGMLATLAWLDRIVPVDPPVFPFLSSDLAPGPDAIMPGAQPGVNVDLVLDEFFTVPIGEAQVPLVYQALVQNTGPTDELFSLSFPDIPGFDVQSSVDEVYVPAGETVRVGVCVQSVGNEVPVPGSLACGVTVTDLNNPSVAATVSESCVIPDVHEVTLSADPIEKAVMPGSSVPVTLTLKAEGNTTENVTLSQNLPNGVSLIGLPNQVSLVQGETKSFDLSLNIGASVAVDQVLTPIITADVAGAIAPSQRDVGIRLSIRSAEIKPIEWAGIKAANQGNLQLAQVAFALTETLAQLQADPTNAGLCNQADLHVENLAALLQITPTLTAFDVQIPAIQAAIASCDSTSLLSSVAQLLADIETILEQNVSTAPFGVSLEPSSLALEPGESGTFIVELENFSAETLTLDLSTGPVPTDVSASLSETSITLGPGEVRDSLSPSPVTLTIDQSLISSTTLGVDISATSPTHTQTTTGLVNVEPAFADVLDVTASPNTIDIGDPIQVVAQIQNSVNTMQSVVARLELLDSTNSLIDILADVPVNLQPAPEPIEMDFGLIDTTGFTEGLFNLKVSLFALDDTPLPGRTAQTPLFVGTLVHASIVADPSVVGPGSPNVMTTIIIDHLLPMIDTTKNLLVNGSFEDGPSVADFVNLEAGTVGANDIPGWTVTQENIDYIGTEWVPSDGDRSIDLDGTPGFGGIAQTFSTVPGQQYQVVFDMAGNPGGLPAVKRMQVEAAGQSAEFSFDVTGRTLSDMGWIEHSWEFTASDSSTTLEFVSLHTGPANFFGPALDNVRIYAVGASLADITITHQLPTSGYKVDPTTITPGATSVTTTEIGWSLEQSLSELPANLMLSGQVPNLMPGETRELSVGTEVSVSFTLLDGTAVVQTMVLPPVGVSTRGILDLEPPTQNVERGGEATYDVLITNPFATETTFDLNVIGLNDLSVGFAEQVTVPGDTTVTELLTIGIPAGFTEGDRAFSIQALNGVMDSVGGVLTIAGGDPGSDSVPTPDAIPLSTQSVHVGVVSDQPIVGQGTAAQYRARVENVGSGTDTYSLNGSFPSGLSGSFAQSSVTIPAGSFVDVPLTVTATAGTSTGDFFFSATVKSTSDSNVMDTAMGSGLVVGQGVAVEWQPSSGMLGDSFDLKVTNTGNTTDTFTLSLGGPGATFAELNTIVVTLAVGDMTTVSVTTDASNQLLPRSLTLVGEATSEANPLVSNTARATLGVDATLGVQAAGTPAMTFLAGPGMALVGVTVENLGNVEDGYRARIIGTTGPISANLQALDGSPTQQIDSFQVPGTQTALLALATELLDLGMGTVLVEVQSLTDPSVMDTAFVTVRSQTGGGSCTACSGTTVMVEEVIELDASDLTGTAGVLLPYVSFDGETILINLGNNALEVTETGGILVAGDVGIQPEDFHETGDHSSPNLHIRSTCAVVIAEGARARVQQKLRNVGGFLETNARSGKAGDILLEVDGPVTIAGGLQSFQEEQPDDATALSGTLTVESLCGDIHVTPTGWVQSWGDVGSGSISLTQIDGGDILIEGLVLNRTNKVFGDNAPPEVNVVAYAGGVAVDGQYQVVDNWRFSGGVYDLTGGLLTLSREVDAVGQITVQAWDDIHVSRAVYGLPLEQTTKAAITTWVNSNSPKGGEIRLRSLQGSIHVQDRAVDASGRGDNSSALIELIADQDVILHAPASPDVEHTPTLTSAATAAGNGLGMGGTNILQACDGEVVAELGTEVLASGALQSGTNELTADNGIVTVEGTVEPTLTTGTPCIDPSSLF